MGNSDFNKYIRSEEFQNLLHSYEKARREDSMVYIDADDMIDIAEYYHSIDDYDNAVAAADYSLELHPEDSTALLFKARMLLIDDHDARRAREVFDRVKDPDEYLESTYIRAELLLYEDKVDAAEALLNKKYAELLDSRESGVDDYDNDAIRFPLDVAMMYVDLTFYDLSKVWMDKIEQPVPGMEYEYFETKARLSHYDGDTQQIIENLNRAIDYDPYSLNAWMQLNDTYFQNGQFEKALECTEYALAIEPDDYEALMSRGNSLYELDRQQEAMECYKKCAQLYPDVDYPCMILGTIYLEREDFEMAMKYLRDAIERSGYDLLVMVRVGIIFYEMNYVMSAYQVFSTIIKTFYEEDMMKECPLSLLRYMVDCCKKLDKEEELKIYAPYLEERLKSIHRNDFPSEDANQ